MQMTYFCGSNIECSNSSSHKALQMAKYNVEYRSNFLTIFWVFILISFQVQHCWGYGAIQYISARLGKPPTRYNYLVQCPCYTVLFKVSLAALVKL